MGSKEKARQFLEASEAHMHYSSIIDHALTYFIAKAEREDRRLAEDLKKVKHEYKHEFAQAIEVTEEVYCEIFSDEEMDALILLHSNPAIGKLRGLTSEIFNRVLEKLALQAN